MFQTESNNYPAEQLSKIVVSILYYKDMFVGYQEKIIFKDAHFYENRYNTKKQLLSRKKYSHDGILIKGELYKDNKPVIFIDKDVDSAGIRHEVILDKNNNIIAHHKYDTFNRFIGGGIYKNNQNIGRKEIRYTEAGTFETIYDDIKHTAVEIRIKPQIYLKKPQPNITNIVLETRVISHKKNGEIYETVYDGTNKIISEPKLIKAVSQAPASNKRVFNNTTEPTILSQEQNIPASKNKIMSLLANLLRKIRNK